MQQQIDQNQVQHFTRALVNQGGRQSQTYRSMVGDSGSTGLVMTNVHPNTNSFAIQRNSFAAQQPQNQPRERISSLGQTKEMNLQPQRSSMEQMQMDRSREDLQNEAYAQALKQQQYFQSMNKDQKYTNMAALNNHPNLNAQFEENMNLNQNQEQTIQNQATQQAYNAQLMRQHQQSKIQPSQSRSHRVSVGSIQTGPNNSAMLRNSNNLQAYNANLQMPQDNNDHRRKSKDAIESYRAVQEAMSRQQAATALTGGHSGSYNQTYNKSNQSRDGSNGPAPGINANDHSSGGSIGSATRSRTNLRVSTSKSILSMIKCPCEPNIKNEQNSRRNLIKADRGKKQPILMSSDNTANCGMCGQFYAIKDTQHTNGRNQLGQQCRIIKTIREKGSIFKLDDSIYELLNRMRGISNKTLATMNPHQCYLEKRVKRIDNLSFIADTLQTDNQTIHHAVHLMDIYSSKMPKNKEYDTLLVSLIALFISTKYLQIKYPGADTLNDLAKRKYSADIIIDMEGVFLDTIDWNLMVFPIYDYVKLFVSQGCLFEHEDILRPTNDDVLDDSDIRDKPSVQLAEHFKKYAEFFADFCLYQECFMTVDPYLLACSIVAYTRKYMGVAIIWPVELEMLTKCTLHHFRDLYLIIDSKYSENFPKHAKSQNYSQQMLTEPQATFQQSIRKNQLMSSSSGGKTQKTQNSSVKPATSINNLNINNLLGDLKTPDKCVFDFNSNVSGNKTLDKFSHQKFQMNSNSVEKFRIQAKNSKNNIKVSSENQVKAQGMIFSDNKKQATQNSLDKQSGNKNNTVSKMILKNQFTNNFSDEKSINQLQPMNKNFLKPNRQADQVAGYSSQKSQGFQGTQNISEVINSVNSPSANINENDNEEEVPPFKPMIIKSNSQAIGGNYECKTTTKKSPKGPALHQINAIKEAMNAANIEARLPSSTTNKSGKLQINNSFANAAVNSGMKSYGNINSNGVSFGPIKINQKIKLVGSSNKKSSGQKSSRTGAEGSSQKKIKISKSYAGQMQGIQQNLNQNFYQEKLAEQRNERANNAKQSANERMSSVASTGQTRSNAAAKQQSYISGKPKAQADYYRQQALNAQNQEQQSSQYGQNNRSILSIKNAAQVIKRKNSFQSQGAIELKVNINKQQAGPPQNLKQPEIIEKQTTTSYGGHQLVPNNMVRTKNMPNGLLRRATGGNQGTQKSIGALSNYNGRGPNARNANNAHQFIQKSNERSHTSEGTYTYFNQDSKMQTMKEGLTPREGEQQAKQVAINPPAIMSNNASNQGSMIKNKSFGGALQHNQLIGKVNNSVEKEAGSQSQHNLHTHHHSTQFRSYISQPNSNQKNYQTQELEEGNKPIKQMIKSGSQVLGKARQRPKMTRSQMLKDLNDKKEKMSLLVEAAHATRCTSNEKTSSTKKPNVSEISARPQVQSFTQKYSHQQYNDGPVGQVTNFEQVINNNAHSEERAAKYHQIISDQDENINAMNIQQNIVPKKGQTFRQDPQPQRYSFQFN